MLLAGQALYKASSHSSPSACDRPGAAERALNIRGEGISRGVEGCPALLPADNIVGVGVGGGSVWIFLVTAQATLVQQTLWLVLLPGVQGETHHRLQALPRPKGGSSRRLDA